jgi:lipopolysaccharide biosynthesis glycosyltransferase
MYFKGDYIVSIYETVDERSIIPIVYSTDNGYVNQTFISIFSLLQNASKNRVYEITVQVPGDFSENSKRYLMNLQNHFSNCDLRIYNMGSEFSNIPLSPNGIRYPTYFRLRIADILSDHDKCIYLDSDLVVVGDISELFDIDVSGVCVAAARDAGAATKGSVQMARAMGIPDTERYFNSGVMLVNLRRWREKNITQQLISSIPKNFFYAEQDILNSILYHEVQFLKLRFNAMPYYVYTNDIYTRHCHSKADAEDSKRSPVVIHYIGPAKPWKNRNIQNGFRWWEYHDMVQKLGYKV